VVHFLKEGVRLGADASGPCLEREGVPVRHRIAVQEAIALSFLGYTGSVERTSGLLSESFEEREGEIWLRRVLDRWGSYLGEGPSRPPDLEFLRHAGHSDRLRLDALRREAAPAAVTWLVTLACNRRCPYCYYAVTHWPAGRAESPADATFPFADAVRMIGEMGQIGAADLYLTGGEPLLRRDLPLLVSAARHAGVRARINTKYPVDRTLARQLAMGGVHEITVSLDDATPRYADALAGAPGYLGEASTAIAALVEAGVPVLVNAVVTRVNAEHLGSLVRLAIDLGVPRLRLSPFAEPFPRREAAARLVPAPINLHARVRGLMDQYGHRIAIEVGPAETPDSEGLEPCGSSMLCEVGLKTLDVLPDGRVTRCRYMPHESGLIVGDLRQETLLDVWNGPRLRALYAPPTADYAGTACHDCGSFGSCNRRGRCFYTAHVSTGRLHGPDVWCTAHAQT
jgi:radical SAM protein with 4Fe4S-binding SPASM domain